MKTKEDILNLIDNFYFVDIETLQPYPDKLIELQNSLDGDIKNRNVAGLLLEMQIVAKLKTILLYKETSESKQHLHKKVVLGLSEAFPPDKDGYIPEFGIKFDSEEEFNMYLEIYDLLYIINEEENGKN